MLLLTFVIQLGTVLKASSPPLHWFDAVSQTFAVLGKMHTGSFFLLLAAVVVLTMLTQAYF